MSVIQKIRDKYSKIAGAVIALALVGFILSDAASGSLTSLFGNDNSVVKVNGDKVDAQEYALRIQEYETIYAMNSQNTTLDENTRMQLREQALRDLINEKIILKQAEKLGLVSSDEENRTIIYGTSPDPMIRQYPVFTNPETGQFDPQRVKMYEQQIMQIDPSGGEKQRWEAYKGYVVRNHTLQKFYNMLTAAAYIPQLQMDNMLQDQSKMVNMRFIKIPYTTINDNEIKVTDADLNAYLEKRKKQYTIHQPTRSIEYVTFDIIPSPEDSARSRDALLSIKADFATTDDVETFVNRNSDESYEGKYYTKATLTSAFADSILSSSVGSVYGPFLENNNYQLVRVLDRKVMPDSVKAQHILISTQQGSTDSAAKLRADSVLLAYQVGANFDSLAMTFSEDPGSKPQGGDLGYFTKNTMVPTFDSFAFNSKTGDVGMVKSQFGYHIIKINDQKSFNPATKLAIIYKSLFPGETTENDVYAQANEFAGKYGNAKSFDEGIKKMNLTRKRADNVKVNDFIIQGIGPARELIRWMYGSEKGEVSGVINMQDKYVIANLKAVQDAGVMKLDENSRPMIEALVKAEKKADFIRKKYASAKSLDQLAQSSGQSISQADSVLIISGFIPGIGYEQKVVGYAFSEKFAPNTLSPGITGQDGVYYISVANRSKRELDPGVTMMLGNQRSMMQSQLQQNIGNMAIEALKNNAEIKYNSNNLY